MNWSWPKKLVYGVAVPVGAPMIKFYRLAKSLQGRPTLVSPFLTSLPVIGLTFLVSGIGESLGYLLGPGNSTVEFAKWEIFQQRTRIR